MQDAPESRLRILLEELERLFASRAPVWEQWAAESIALLEAGDRRATDHILQAFGGMGGLSDLVFDPDNDNARSLVEAAWLHRELDARRSEVHALATQLHTERSKQRRADREYLRELRARVARWDPLGLIGLGAPSDQYESLLAPLVSGLRDGLAPADLAQVLRDHLIEGFELEPSGADQFAMDITEWHRRGALELSRPPSVSPDAPAESR